MSIDIDGYRRMRSTQSMRKSSQPGSLANFGLEERLYRRWNWANSRRIAGVPSPFLGATALFSLSPPRPNLFESRPEAAALTCVRETHALTLFFGESVSAYMAAPNRCGESLDFYVRAASNFGSRLSAIGVLAKPCFAPLRSSSLIVARNRLEAEFPDGDHSLILAQMLSPTRLSLIDVIDVEPRVLVSAEKQYDLVDIDQVLKSA